MVIHLHPVSRDLEKSVRFVSRHLVNIVECLTRESAIIDEAAWEVLVEGVIDALVPRLAAEEYGEDYAQAIADQLAYRMREHAHRARPAR